MTMTKPLITGKTIIKGHSFPSKKFSQAKLASGFHVQTVKRRGKYLLINLDKELGGKTKLKELIIHLGMTGSVSIAKEETDDPYVRAQWQLNDGQILLFRDIRRFGRIAVVNPNDYKSLPTLNNTLFTRD